MAHVRSPALRRHPRGNSIYVTASNNLSQDLAEAAAEAEAEAEAEAGSGASSPRSRSSAASPGRVLRPPWSLRRQSGSSTGAEAAGAAGGPAGAGQDAAAGVAAHSPLHGGLGSLEGLQEGAAEGQLASVLGASNPLAAELEGLHLSEEEALQRALELSLADARQPAALTEGGQDEQQQAEGNGMPAGGAPEGAEQQAADGQPMHVRYNPAFASSGSDGQRNLLYGGTSGDGAPHST